jgi:hypothetical protein
MVSIGLVYSIHDSTEVAIQKMIEASQRKKELGKQNSIIAYSIIFLLLLFKQWVWCWYCWSCLLLLRQLLLIIDCRLFSEELKKEEYAWLFFRC